MHTNGDHRTVVDGSDGDEQELGSSSADASHSLLHPSPQDDASHRPSTLTPQGRRRAYWLGMIVCIGGFLFGYDSGIIGGVLTFPSFARDFRYDAATATRFSSMAVSLQQLGAFVACFLIWPVTHRLGRKAAIVICSIIFLVGVVLQTIDTHSVSAFLIGRVVAGVGLGGSSVVVPMFSSEMVPKEIRGQVGSLYQLMFTLGIFTSYWLDWGVAKIIPTDSSLQWQVPIGLQMLFAALLCIGTLTLKESVRWLAQTGQYDKAWESLRWIRASDDETSQAEMKEIRRGVDVEAGQREGLRYLEMLQNGNAGRTLTAVAVFTAQQATGASAFAYFGPQYFHLLVGSHDDNDSLPLLLTAIFGLIKVMACGTFVLFLADRVGRRNILAWGALFMAGCQLLTAAVTHTYPTSPSSSSSLPDISPSAIVTVALIYLFVTAYNFSWGPLPWPYVSEIFPARTREPGMGVGVSAQWFWNFVFSFVTPYMIRDLGGGTFVVWGLLDVAIALFAWKGLKETRGRSLEDIAEMEGDAGNGEEAEERGSLLRPSRKMR